ncbi:MAG: hypothetical protein HRF49_10190 [bacterium]|jgi:hypothetical protein
MAEILKATTTEVVLNEDGGDIDFRVEGDTHAAIIFADAGNDKVLLGADVVSVLDARVTCRQTSTTAAIPVLELSQSDTDQPFIKFSGGTLYTGKVPVDEYILVEWAGQANPRYLQLNEDP